MAYNNALADKVRALLAEYPGLKIEEKKMFRGVSFMVNGKMCISVSGENLMCRFDPERTEELAAHRGFAPMIMKGREYKGYCYISSEGFRNNENLAFWIDVCLAFNAKAKASKKSTGSPKKQTGTKPKTRKTISS
jgi:TfoX/Sxy family transcriptional regulator of competence genes